MDGEQRACAGGVVIDVGATNLKYGSFSMKRDRLVLGFPFSFRRGCWFLLVLLASSWRITIQRQRYVPYV